MCPVCIGNAALIVGGAVSASGWTVFVRRKPRAENRRRQGPAPITSRETNAGPEPATSEETRS
jgi:hypothetical protein